MAADRYRYRYRYRGVQVVGSGIEKVVANRSRSCHVCGKLLSRQRHNMPRSLLGCLQESGVLPSYEPRFGVAV